MREFEIEISRPGTFGALTSATLELPATWAEYNDAMQKARITDDRVIYEVEICDIKRRSLQGRIGAPVHLPELNLLAQRLAELPQHQSSIFDAMVSIEAQKNHNDKIPLPRLINFTHSLDSCHVAPGMRNDVSLGRWLFENDMLPQEVHDFAAARIFWGSETEDERFGLIGARHRQRENGVFSSVGYVEVEAIQEVYTPGNTVYFHRSDAPVVLSVSKGFFNDPSYDNEQSISIDLPLLTDKRMNEVLEALGAASLDEIGYHCADCQIPAAKDLIDDAEDIGAVNRFAKALADMEQYTHPALYKAMLEVVKPPDLEAATTLAGEIQDYTLITETSGPEDYAKEYLSRLRGGNDSIDLSEMINLYALGEKVMKLENAEWTSYGILKRKDGGPIWTMDSTVDPTAGMEMGGL
ncbi:hypothetical protein LJC60_04100 [Ruminococcaceae bacterium OttesenSCG-928-D13]|nr:hypothetical protein [Ruminococcaceae bacterium OttesenSCG-928-D13]